ncbi:MAG: S41 family peptidase [Minisyncoccia bacterium]
MKLSKKSIFLALLIGVVIVGGLTYSSSSLSKKFFRHQAVAVSPTPTPDKYLAFSFEVWDKIKQNYWDKISDSDLANLYKLGAQKIVTASASFDPKSRDDVGNLIEQIIKDKPDDKKVGFVTQLADIVLANLKPFGRSRLYNEKQTQALTNTVQNKDPNTDLYSALGVTKDATTQDIKTAYTKKEQELKTDKSAAAQQQLATVQRAYDALSTTDSKIIYDATGVEPTVTSKLISPDIYYIKLSKFSPQSFDELKKAADKIDPNEKNGPTSLIFDLRGNIGGDIDILQYFLGPFIGPNNYAYDFFHQGNTTPYKTQYGWFDSLVRYKKVVILINNQDQSSAEVMAATLKKYHVGVLVGTTTKGWGTVEQDMPLQNQLTDTDKYSVFLVNSITLRDDGLPIEGRGVDPDVNINDKDWQKQLLAYFNYPALVNAVNELVTSK